MDRFKPILADEGGNVAVFSNVHMEAEITLYHQDSVQCWANLFVLGSILTKSQGAHTLVHFSVVYVCLYHLIVCF